MIYRDVAIGNKCDTLSRCVEEDSGSLSITDVVMREVSSYESVIIAVPFNQIHDVIVTFFFC